MTGQQMSHLIFTGTSPDQIDLGRSSTYALLRAIADRDYRAAEWLDDQANRAARFAAYTDDIDKQILDDAIVVLADRIDRALER